MPFFFIMTSTFFRSFFYIYLPVQRLPKVYDYEGLYIVISQTKPSIIFPSCVLWRSQVATENRFETNDTLSVFRRVDLESRFEPDWEWALFWWIGGTLFGSDSTDPYEKQKRVMLPLPTCILTDSALHPVASSFSCCLAIVSFDFPVQVTQNYNLPTLHRAKQQAQLLNRAT